jgi:sugar/nucleoside kinase (ribokinase family)
VAELDLLVLGDGNPDLIVSGDAVPAFGQAEKLVDEARLVVGGSGAIMACGAARLGLRTAFAGVVGDDPFGRFMIDALGERGVETDPIVVEPETPTGLSVVLLAGEDRAILTSLGTIAELRAEIVDRDLIATARHVHVSSYFLQHRIRPGLPELFDAAHRAGASTSVDPNWDPLGNWDGDLLALLDRTDVFLPNSAEARAITGIDDIDVATELLAEHGSTVAVKFGQGGGLAMRGAEVARSEAIPASVVDTTGAGDSFDAGFVAGLLAGWSLDRCLSLAVASGSLSTREMGGTAAQPSLEEALAALEATI